MDSVQEKKEGSNGEQTNLKPSAGSERGRRPGWKRATYGRVGHGWFERSVFQSIAAAQSINSYREIAERLALPMIRKMHRICFVDADVEST
jgi:hypothetical protein